MSINLKHTIYLSLATLTLFANGSTIVNAAKNSQTSSVQKTSKSNSKKSQSSNKSTASSSVSKSKNSSSSVSSSSTSKKNNSNTKKTTTQTEKSSSQSTSKKKTSSGKGTNNQSKASSVKIISNKKIPNQKYDKVLTGKNPIFNNPGTISGSKVTFNKSTVRQLIKQNARFMTYQVAKTSNGLTYYKIVSQHHSVRGWIYANGISDVNSNSKSSKKKTNKKNNKQSNTEKNLVDQINGMINNAKNLATQAQSAANNNDSNSSNNLMQQANGQISSAQTTASQLKDDSDKDSIDLSISQATSDIQKIQDSIQSSTNASDSGNLTSTNNFVNTAYNALNSVKIDMKNNDISPLDTASQLVLAQNALQSATNVANQIKETTTKNGALNQVNGAINYMTTLANNAKAAGVDTPTSIPSNDTIRYSLITHYVDKANFYIDDIKNNQLIYNLINKTRVDNDTSNARASLQVAYNLMLGLQDPSLSTSANQLISNTISYIQNNSTMAPNAINSASSTNSNAVNTNSNSASSAANNANSSNYLAGNHNISK